MNIDSLLANDANAKYLKLDTHYFWFYIPTSRI